MQSVVDAMAAVMRKGGDRRPIGQLRVDALRQLLTRPWETLPEDVARASWQLRLRVDLADLHDHRDDHPDHLAPVLTAGAAAPVGPAPCAAGAEALDAVAAGRGPRTPGTASIGGLSVGPVAVAELLARSGALAGHRTGGRVDGGQVWFEVVDSAGRLRAVASPSEARSAHRRGAGLGPPPEVQGYVPIAAQVRFVKARDQHCRFPGCHRPADHVDLDHVVPRDHRDPGAGGPTCVTNLACLCRRHHRLKTHAPGWAFAVDADGTLHVTPPGGRTRTTRPVAVAEAHVAAGTQPDTFTELFGRTPRQYRTPTPEERARRRATAAERAGVAAEIDAELEAARARRAQGLEVAGVAPVHDEPPF
ncbi:HNH endonuclease signature motif containing protein [Modestobacter sp. Leaf380]|uniref:HNH endonuclease signature motif containing protein n=1 Tax=Modestobacter sp. Leaf380 TaxID=1736356 RepID=UPI0006F7CBB9|nr:HNH endonuclease signature motif containing protein [Modestobacter sp. Leaf380]KQS65865.1 hypothetical protein ASG41_14980 [Modestobacter sp. Leaf380]